MQFIRKKLTGFNDAEVLKSAAAAAVGKLASPVIAGGQARLFELLGQKKGASVPEGDVFCAQNGNIIFYSLDTEDSSLILGEVYADAGTSMIQTAIDEISYAYPEIICEDYSMVSPFFELLREDSKNLSVDEWDRKAAGCLINPGVRELLRVVADKKSVSLPEAAQGRDIFEVGADVQQMNELGIICREFEVFCKKTGQKVSRVSSLTALDEAAKRGFRCFHCGKAISDEQIVQSLSISEGGARLAVNNMWLVYIVGAAIKDCGVKAEHILFRYEEGYGYCDIFANYKGRLFMFTVSENGLNADSVFRIVSRSKFFHPDCVFAVSPIKVNADTLRLAESCDSQLFIVDDLGSLNEAIKCAADRADKSIVINILEHLDDLTCVNVSSIVSGYFIDSMIAPAAKNDAEESYEENTLENISEHAAENAEASEEAAAKAGDAGIKEASADKKSKKADHAAEESAAVNEERSFIPEVTESFNELASKLRDAMLEMSDMDVMEDCINKLSENEHVGAMIVGDDGMPMMGSLGKLNDEAAAAMQLEFISTVNFAAEKASLGAVNRVFVAYNEGSINIYPSAEGSSLMLHSTEAGSLKFGGRSSRNDSIKKSLLGLTVVDSVFDAIIIKDDFIQEATAPNFEDLASACGRMCSAAGAFLSELGLGRWYCTVIDSDTQLLAAYLLRGGHIVVCVLDKKASESVWCKSIPNKLLRVENVLG